jgi:hypothetical protein
MLRWRWQHKRAIGPQGLHEFKDCIMSAGKWNIAAEQGVTFNPTLTCKDSSGAMVNLSGYSARMQVRDSYEATAKLFDLTTDNGGITLGGAGGTVALRITAEQMATILIEAEPGLPPVKTCVYDLELVNGPSVIRLLEGTFSISREVTR